MKQHKQHKQPIYYIHRDDIIRRVEYLKKCYDSWFIDSNHLMQDLMNLKYDNNGYIKLGKVMTVCDKHLKQAESSGASWLHLVIYRVIKRHFVGCRKKDTYINT